MSKINLTLLVLGLVIIVQTGCNSPQMNPRYDRPFPVGQNSDSFWESQQANAEATKFIMFDHDFEGDTANLTPAGQKHLTSIAKRLPYVPFPVIIEESINKRAEEESVLDEQRRRNTIGWLQKFYGPDQEKLNIENRVVIAKAFPRPMEATEGEAAYYSSQNGSNGGGFGGGRGGSGGFGGGGRGGF